MKKLRALIVRLLDALADPHPERSELHSRTRESVQAQAQEPWRKASAVEAVL